jgi:hypothetical protein
MAASSSTTKISPDSVFAKDAVSSAIFSGFHARRRPSSPYRCLRSRVAPDFSS